MPKKKKEVPTLESLAIEKTPTLVDLDLKDLSKIVKETFSEYEKKRTKQYRKWGFYISLVIVVLTAISLISLNWARIESYVVFQADFEIEVSGATSPFENSLLNNESLIYTIEPKLETSETFETYNDLQCTFSYKNLSKELLKTPVLKIYLIDAIDRVIAYKEYKCTNSKKVNFVFKEESKIRENRGNIRVLITAWDEENKLVSYSVFESEYKKEGEPILLSIITLAVGVITGLIAYIMSTGKK